MALRMLTTHFMVRSTPRIRSRRAYAQRGFTLIELSAVVTIVGILSVIGIVSYRSYLQSSKVTEGRNVIAAIKIAQEDHRAEAGTYVDVGKTAYCPHDPKNMGGKKTSWGACTGKWTALPVHVSGPMYFGYLTTSGTEAPAPASKVTYTLPANTPSFIVTAEADLDASGSGSPMTSLVLISTSNQIFTFDEGD
jgi:prepilin-type N-terminal cleavage/methylation domain-containing protein